MENSNKKTELLNYLIPIIEDIIKNEFTAVEKKHWDKSLKYLKTDITNLFSVFFSSAENNINFPNINDNPSISILTREDAEPLAAKLYKNVKADKKMLSNFSTLLLKINLLYQSKINNEFQDLNSNIISKLQNNTTLLGQIHNYPRLLVDTNYPSIRTFVPNTKCIFNYTILRHQLQEHNFLNKDVDVESFKMIFSQERINSKFNKISWLGSIFELKTFITELYGNEILLDNLNYYYTIIDCFNIDDKEIDYDQLKSPKGSKKKLDLIKRIISNCIIKK